ncbi:MAG: 6-carboxytetrahydropterin synthase [Candidatus Omnitrophica bacterium]|jgi:6-pyruvoyltetrahydropterin/6-carboxytetrahydropterin synthase|nr:6-carboxytetrahydropterin synthase [Candidatus Omnitrophota bacterium]
MIIKNKIENRMYKIKKEFNFCYGHRVWTQQLNSEYSVDSNCGCRALHGHNGTITVELESETLNEQGMVVDFKMLNWFKKFIDEELDHKFLMDLHDPLFNYLFPLVCHKQFDTTEIEIRLSYHPERHYTPDLDDLKKISDEDLIELYKGLVVLDFVPTSENLSKWFFEIIQDKIKPLNVKVSSVQFDETPKSHSTYSV